LNIKTLAFGLLLAAASPAFASDIDGKWSGAIDTPNGPVTINYTFKAQGATLTGATSAPDGREIAISDGKIMGNKVSFSLTLDFGQGPATINYSGEFTAAELKLHSEFMNMPFDFTLKKSK
jgi:hypothetical protein